MSEADSQVDSGGGGEAPAPGTPAPPRLRRRPFGYKRTDVDEALSTRDAQLAELRQDIAALWLAFAQHDRMIRELAGEPPRSPAPEPAPPQPASPNEDPPATGEDVGRQLSELDEALTAIEMATQTLERTYSDEVEETKSPAGTDATASEDAPEQRGLSGTP